jgi:hypothetical protein
LSTTQVWDFLIFFKRCFRSFVSFKAYKLLHRHVERG